MPNTVAVESLCLVCTPERFSPVTSPHTRWLAPKADFYRYEQMLLTREAQPPTYETWTQWHEQGYGFAAYVVNGTVRSIGTVLRQPDSDWELAGVRTLEKHQRMGCATAVASFITNYILQQKGRVVCRIDSENAAMWSILEKLGYTVS